MQKNILICFLLAALAIMATAVFAGYTGSVGLTIDGTTQVSFTTTSVAWGTGSVTATGTPCTLDTGGTKTGCTGFTAVSAPLVIANTGTFDVILELSSSEDASEFIGGTSPSFQWKVTNNVTDSCGTLPISDYANVAKTATVACAKFLKAPGCETVGTMNVNLKVVIPSDATVAAQSATITATATKWVS
jgi:hypothetical protein